MRLKRTQDHLKEIGVKHFYTERNGLGRISIGKTKIIEHYIRPGRTNIYAENINLMDEEQLIGWINTNKDRFK